jgi:hypothetical protein
VLLRKNGRSIQQNIKALGMGGSFKELEKTFYHLSVTLCSTTAKAISLMKGPGKSRTPKGNPIKETLSLKSIKLKLNSLKVSY